MVDIGPLGPSHSHHTEIVLREHLNEASHAIVDDIGRFFIEVVFVFCVEFFAGILL